MTIPRFTSPAPFMLAAIFLILLASSAPAPLYAVFRAEYGLTAFDQSLVFVTHTVGMLLALFGFKSLTQAMADQRVPVALGTACCLAGAVIFALSGGLFTAVLARFLIGFGGGILTGPVTAGLMRLWGASAARKTAVWTTGAFTLGGAVGPSMSGLFIQADFFPTIAPFAVSAVLAVVILLGLALSGWNPRSQSPAAGGLSRISPRQTMSMAAIVAIYGVGTGLCWACLGTIMTLGSNAQHEIFSSGNGATIAYALTAMQLLAGFCQIAGATGSPRANFAIGTGIQAMGLASLVVSLTNANAMLALAGMLLISAGYGLAFVGAAATVNLFSSPEKLATATSSFYLAAYGGNFVPLAVARLADVLGLRTALIGSLSVLCALQGAILICAILMARRRMTVA